MTRILVCYQIGDGETLTRRLIDSLREEFGTPTVKDIQDGQGFKGFRRGDTLVVMIGPAWAAGAIRQRERSDNFSDSFRAVLGSALLDPNIFIIPVLLNNVPEPRFDDLPLEIQKLTLQEIMPCRDEIYERDTGRIIHAIRVRNAAKPSSGWLSIIAAVVVLLLIAGGVFLFSRSQTFKTIAGDFDANMERIDPSRVDSYRDQAWAFYDAGDYAQAIPYFQKVVRLLVSDSGAYGGLAWSYYYLKQYDEAEKNFNRVVELAPSMTSSYMERGRFYQAVGNAEAAIPDFEKVTVKSPINEEAFMSLASSYEAVGNYREAIQNYQHIITEINGRNAAAYYGLGKSQDALKRYKQALDSFQHYLELETTNPDPVILQRVEELKLLVTP